MGASKVNPCRQVRRHVRRFESAWGHLLGRPAVEKLGIKNWLEAHRWLRKNIVFVHRSEEKFHISIKRLGKSGLKMLTETALDESPSVSPNNNFIIYATKDAENGYLAGISLDGLAKFKIPSKIGAIREPVWSPFLN